ncbi:MAG: SPOR domain-containing protein [Phycisphaeraceae bacterium]|nr:MAG: SPOR domain-containing protein [Phycisphaeraceae bacterium]
MKSNRFSRFVQVMALAVMGAGLVLGGCKSAKSTSYMDAYNSGNHAEAYKRASEASVSGPQAQREQAALVAGLSAHSLGRDSDAKRHLQPLAYSSNPEVAGKANATLGLMAEAQGDNAAAARAFELAGSKLTGDEAARAYLHAGDAYAAAGNKTLADSMYKRGLSMATGDIGLSSTIRERMNAPAAGGETAGNFGGSASGPFSIQLGAFSSRANAERLASQVAGSAATMGMGQPRIVPTNKNGQTLFAVRVGGFGTRNEAAAARDRFGKGGFVAANAD